MLLSESEYKIRITHMYNVQCIPNTNIIHLRHAHVESTMYNEHEFNTLVSHTCTLYSEHAEMGIPLPAIGVCIIPIHGCSGRESKVLIVRAWFMPGRSQLTLRQWSPHWQHETTPQQLTEEVYKHNCTDSSPLCWVLINYLIEMIEGKLRTQGSTNTITKTTRLFNIYTSHSLTVWFHMISSS